jgi:integrase/recombinase XerD
MNQVPAAIPAVPTQAHSDDHLIDLWLHGRSPTTQRAYRADVTMFMAAVSKPLQGVTLGDLQAYQDRLAAQSTASQSRRISSVKSLLTFGHRVGYLVVNVGAAVSAPPVKQTLSERILTEEEVLRVIALEPNVRNRTILKTLYACGLRISECCNLKVRDLQPRENGGQITIFGKGDKTRTILVKQSVWKDLALFRSGDPDAAVFRSREGGGPMDPMSVHRVVKAAAGRAGLSEAVSAHWLRHAHVSHALDHGAPAHLVQQTAGHASLTTTSKYAHARPSDSSSLYLPI